MLHWTNRLASEGLGKGLAMLFASQRPQKVHNDTLTSAETLIAMRVLHPSDRGAVDDWIKGCGDSEGSEVLKSLANMERGEGWVWSPEIGFGPTRVKFPMFSTYDSFRPQSVADSKRLKGWAEVDLDEVRQKLAAVVEKAKADDPRELRKQIAELKGQLKKSAPSEHLSANVREKVKTVEKFVLKDGQLARAEQIAQRVEQCADKFHQLEDRLSEIEEDFATVAKEIRDAIRQTHNTPATTAVVRPSPHARRVAPAQAQATSRRPARVVSPESSNGYGTLGKAERAILTVLAQHDHGCDKSKLTILTRYRYSGGFRNSLSTLRTSGYLVGGNDDSMRITDAGLSAIGDWQPLPAGADLADYWLSHSSFGKAERAILSALLAHRVGLTADELCQATGYEFSGGFRNSLSVLRTAGVIIGKNTEVMKASDELFD